MRRSTEETYSGRPIGNMPGTEGDETVVRYSILAGNGQLFASTYMRWLPTEEELIAEVER